METYTRAPGVTVGPAVQGLGHHQHPSLKHVCVLAQLTLLSKPLLPPGSRGLAEPVPQTPLCMEAPRFPHAQAWPRSPQPLEGSARSQISCPSSCRVTWKGRGLDLVHQADLRLGN